MSGEMRRPPQLWEQRLARTTAILGAGISSSGDATAIVPPSPAPGGGGGTEPAPVPPPAGSFTTPSKPTLFRQVQGLGVLWDGLNADGDLWPYDTSWVEIHADTSGSAFTPSDATLKGRLARPGIYSIGGLTQGSTYFVRLRGADPAGNYTAAGAAESALTGGTITAVYISGGTMAAGYLSGGTISGGLITGGTINGATITSTGISGYATTGDIANFITGGDVNPNVTSISGGVITSGTIIGRTVQSSSGSARIVLNNADTLDFYSSNVKRGDLYGVTVSGINGIGVTGALDVSSTIFGQSLSISGTNVDFLGVTTGSTTADAGFNGDRLRKKTSSQRYKYDITPLTGTLHPDVDADKQVEAATVNPTAILDLAVAEFSWLEEGLPTDKRDLGFIAEDVAAKFPIAASLGPDGIPIAVRDTPILAALLAVVQDMEQTIEDLRSRIEALEA
jgi:hypothetical protein